MKGKYRIDYISFVGGAITPWYVDVRKHNFIFEVGDTTEEFTYTLEISTKDKGSPTRFYDITIYVTPGNVIVKIAPSKPKISINKDWAFNLGKHFSEASRAPAPIGYTIEEITEGGKEDERMDLESHYL